MSGCSVHRPLAHHDNKPAQPEQSLDDQIACFCWARNLRKSERLPPAPCVCSQTETESRVALRIEIDHTAPIEEQDPILSKESDGIRMALQVCRAFQRRGR